MLFLQGLNFLEKTSFKVHLNHPYLNMKLICISALSVQHQLPPALLGFGSCFTKIQVAEVLFSLLVWNKCWIQALSYLPGKEKKKPTKQK